MARESAIESIPLVRAAVRAGVGYNVVLGAVLRRELEGSQDPSSRRWFVRVRSLEAWLVKRARRGLVPQPAAASSA